MITDSRSNVLEKLWAAAAACEYCAESCLDEGHTDAMRECIRAGRDCVDICVVTARFVARSSRHTRHVMEECLEICNECAVECERYDHPHCISCALACRAAIEACLAYLG